jgi:glycogen debranching enzyme
VRIEPHGHWPTGLQVVTDMGALEAALPDAGGRPSMARGLEKWVGKAPRLESSAEYLKATYQRSIVDLAALRFSPALAAGDSLPAAGLPWFMTMFGRDSIFASLQALPFMPELAATTLRVLGAWQGSRVDDFRDEDPGRILHEMRYGEMTAFEERPHSPYYGSADATPLYVVLMDEYERWTGDSKLVRDFEPQVRTALNWIGEYADLQGNGYVSYKRRNEETGLENQCWKDSWDSISYHDGTLPGFPRATCELQGYAYDAKVRGARLARRFWRDPELVGQLEKEAVGLKRCFNRGFWVKDRGYFAVALDTDGRRVDSLTSNIGHLLWSGIVEKSKARNVVRHLMSARLFSGWGCGPRPKAKAATTRSVTTWARSGRSTTPSAHGACGNTVSRKKLRASPRASWGGPVLRQAPAGSLRRVPAADDQVSRPVSDSVQPAGVVNRRTAPPATRRPRLGGPRGQPGGRSGIGQ